MLSLLDILRNTSKRKLLILLFSALMLVNSAFIYLYFPSKFKEQSLQSYIDKANTIADMVSLNVASALYSNDIESVEKSITSFKGIKDIEAIIIFDSLGTPFTVSKLKTGKEIIKNIGLAKINNLSNDKNHYSAIRIIEFNNKNLGKINVIMSLTKVNKDVSESKQLISIISLIMFLLGSFAVLAISSFFMNPLLKLLNTFLEISNGDISSRVDIKTKDEFGNLGLCFNSMVDKLEATQKKLFEMNIALEDKVEERTIDLMKEIEERKKAVLNIRKNEEKYRSIFEKFQDVYFKIDMKGIFIDLSPSIYNFSGYQAFDLIGKSIDTINYDKLNKFEFLKLLLAHEKISNYEISLSCKNGDYINVNINAQLEYNSDNRPEYISGTLHDITYLKKIETQLIELNFTKDKFFSIIAHDLRNPISSFMQGTDILEHDYEILSDAERIDIISSLNKTSKRLLDLLEDLLTWSRSQTGKISFTPDYSDIFPIIRNNISLLELQAGNKNILLKSESLENTIGFFDVNMVNTVIRNLISNAIKFTPEGGIITIGSKIVDENIKVWVKDTGIGISVENRAKLFKIDSSLTTSGTANEKGTGLGLILCKELIEKNRGTIWVESELNKGTSFIFTVPTVQESINNNP